MAASPSHLPRFARDLLFNPVPCGVSLHVEPSAATFILEAVVPAYIADHPQTWLVCSHPACEREARLQADSYLPIDVDFRPVTVLELETISGLDVTAASGHVCDIDDGWCHSHHRYCSSAISHQQVSA